MTHLTHLAHFDSPMPVVRRCAVDPTLMPQYWPMIKKVWDIKGDQESRGDSFRFAAHLLGRDVEGTSEVVAIDGATYDTLTTYDNGTRLRWKMTFTPRGGGTDVLNEIDYEVPPGPLWAILDRLLLKRNMIATLESGDQAFKHIVRAEAVRTS